VSSRRAVFLSPVFLPADDPSIGKIIVAGLFVRELRIRGDIERRRPI
jgi:hypothetical protein